jgi:hypothetical protein
VDRVSPLFICDPIKGTMKIHSICATNKNNFLQLLVKDLACFYEFCLDSCWTKCQMWSGQGNGFLNNFNLMIHSMYKKQCMMGGMESGNLVYKVSFYTWIFV